MKLIHDHLHDWDHSQKVIDLSVDRLTLAKRRWRGTAADGTEFGFDLTHPLANGDVFAQTETAVYRIAQQAEPVLEIPLESDPAAAARLGWTVGNLHFPIEVADGCIRMVDDPALRQLCEREHLHVHACERVFTPLGGGHSHHHH
ncbi:MAG: urease accessory protein UreE [Chthoniobacteraceae bacterium]